MWCIVDRSPTQQTRPWGGAQQATTFPTMSLQSDRSGERDHSALRS